MAVKKERKEKGRDWGPKEVKSLRSQLGLTQQELARRLGIRQQTVSEWEVGVHRPRGASLTLIRMVADQARPLYQVGRARPAQDLLAAPQAVSSSGGASGEPFLTRNPSQGTP